MIEATVDMNLDGLKGLVNKVGAASGPGRAMLKQWAATYRSFVQQRFERYSKGGGDWKPLSPITIAKRRKGKKARASLKRRIEKLKKGSTDREAMAKKKRISATFAKAAKRGQGLAKKAARATRRKLSRIKMAGKRKLAEAKKVGRRFRSRRELKRKIRQLQAKLDGLKPNILRDLGLLFAALNPSFNAKGGLERVEGLSITVGYGGPARHPKGKATIADIARFHDTGAGRVPRRQIIVQPDMATLDIMSRQADRAMKKLAEGEGL